MTLLIGTARTVADGEQIPGDEIVVVRADARVLIGLADGLGHGPHAAHAASVFCRYVEAQAAASLEDILLGVGDALASTRGAAAALLRIDERAGELEFSGVGNVALKALAHAPMPMFCAAGILGRRVRKLRSFRSPIHPGDIVALHSDGVSAGFDLATFLVGRDSAFAGPSVGVGRDSAFAGPFKTPDPEQMARRIVEAHRKPFDDATCVVAVLSPDKAQA